MIIKIERPIKGPQDIWDMRDEAGTLRRQVRPGALPKRIQDVVAFAGRAYFYAEQDGERLTFKHRVTGNPNWA